MLINKSSRQCLNKTKYLRRNDFRYTQWHRAQLIYGNFKFMWRYASIKIQPLFANKRNGKYRRQLKYLEIDVMFIDIIF